MTVVEEAVALKQKGNKAFAEHDWPAAVDYYTQAINLHDQDPSFYCNRAQVSLSQFSSAIQLFIHDILISGVDRPTSNSRHMDSPLLMRPGLLSSIPATSRCEAIAK